MSCSDALTKKYSWRSRSSRPAGVLSFGYSTQRDVLGLVLHAGGARVVAAVEGVQVDVRRRRRLPQAQRADRWACRGPAPPCRRPWRPPRRRGATAAVPPCVLDPAAEAHRVAHAGARKLPGVPSCEPGVGVLDLAAVVDLLREHAVLVADAVAERRQPERGHRVEEARREPAQAAVAERRRRARCSATSSSRWRMPRQRLPRRRRASPSAASALPSVRPIRNSIDR